MTHCPKKTSATRAAEAQTVIDWLASTWPHLVDRPLAVGIRQALQPHLPEHISQNALRRALSCYTGRDVYLRALAAEDSQRVALDGSTTPVSAEHRQHAQEQLCERLAVRSAKRIAKPGRAATTTPSAAPAAPSPAAAASSGKLTLTPNTTPVSRTTKLDQPILSLKRTTSVASS